MKGLKKSARSICMKMEILHLLEIAIFHKQRMMIMTRTSDTNEDDDE